MNCTRAASKAVKALDQGLRPGALWRPLRGGGNFMFPRERVCSKSGGRKHKKKPAGAGKGPAAKGGGKRFAAGGFVSGWFPMTLHDHVTVRFF